MTMLEIRSLADKANPLYEVFVSNGYDKDAFDQWWNASREVGARVWAEILNNSSFLDSLNPGAYFRYALTDLRTAYELAVNDISRTPINQAGISLVMGVLQVKGILKH